MKKSLMRTCLNENPSPPQKKTNALKSENLGECFVEHYGSAEPFLKNAYLEDI